MRPADYAIAAVVLAFLGYVAFMVQGKINYQWRWNLIPNYILRWDDNALTWKPNVLLEGFLATIRICVYSGILAAVFGVILGFGRASNNLTIRLLSRTYVELLRNIPPVVIIFIFYFFISRQIIDLVGLEGWSRGIAKQEGNGVYTFLFGDMRQFSSLASGVLVIALFQSAFVGEIVRTGIQSVPNGQREAARSIGMSRLQEIRYIVMPQAFSKVLPPLANQFIFLIKDSSIVSIISVQELTYKSVELISSTRMIFEVWAVTTALYFILCFGLSMMFRHFEAKSLTSAKL
ncbi:MAG: amino acid ABC transporter permease [Pelagibacterium sp. SCN 63-23]|nr:MAG: amino acid ABC transporter permease [Pelagibacterium sp. SCN 63-23]